MNKKTPETATELDVGFQPSICPRCGYIRLDTDLGAELCPYHADPVVLDVIAQ